MRGKSAILRLVLAIGFGIVITLFVVGKTGDDQYKEIDQTVGTGAQPIQDAPLTNVRTFTAQEFRDAYDDLSLPNITPIIEAPPITGNQQADARIQQIAEERGYKLRDVASGLLNEIDDKPVQELLIADWQSLIVEAQKANIIINFVSGYRSVEDQRDIFITRLEAAGGNSASIASGTQDQLVSDILRTTAPPGYSRHHSGYTIDVEQPGYEVFAYSEAYAWLSNNNFEKAKKHGFIPSYPEGVENQGPNPEEWEFVWVGKQVTYQE